MKKHVLLYFIFFFQFGFAQSNLNWKGYFSYNQIKDITEASDRIIGAAENAFFSKNILSNTIKTANTIDGLSGQTITAIYHSEIFKKTIIGYENGLLIIVNDVDGSVTNVVDIINKSIPPNIKRINHFLEHEGIIYISCDFGIVQYNINTLNFGDTYFIGPNGAEIKIYQTAVLNNEIYAVTVLNGIKKAALTNPNLNDFNQWQTFDAGFWNGIVTFNNQLVGSNLDNRVYKYNGSFFEQIVNLNQAGLDIRTYDDKLTITTANHVYVYNTSFNQLAHIQTSQITDQVITFNCATVINNTIYIGTNDNGILTSTIESPTNFEYILPDGPTKNRMFSISSSSTNLWAVYGGYNIEFNPYLYIGFSLSQFGVSKFSESDGWLNIPYSEMLDAKALTRATINPNNENETYISSYNNGLIKIENDIPTTLFQSTNSSLESIVSGSLENIRIGPSAFDRSNNLWITNSRINNGLKVLRANGQWQSYNMESILAAVGANDYSRIVIDRNGTKWIGSSQNGLIAFNENNNVFKKITEGVDEGNLPAKDVRALAIDNRNQVWIGTSKGLRVLSSISSYNNEDQINTNRIVIQDGDIGQELLFEQFVTDIEVDGSNRKWIGTADSGVFLFSPNGQETIYHFTTDNSPLPSNSVNEIAINATTGEVYFATDRGMISFQGTSTKPADDLKNVYVYPNPVRPEFVGTVKIAGLISKATIKITDIEGNLVHETTSEGGTIEWDTTAFGKYKVASGVYMIFISAEDGSETTVKKVMIVR